MTSSISLVVLWMIAYGDRLIGSLDKRVVERSYLDSAVYTGQLHFSARAILPRLSRASCQSVRPFITSRRSIGARRGAMWRCLLNVQPIGASLDSGIRLALTIAEIEAASWVDRAQDAACFHLNSFSGSHKRYCRSLCSSNMQGQVRYLCSVF